jgi:hypothetical protein
MILVETTAVTQGGIVYRLKPGATDDYLERPRTPWELLIEMQADLARLTCACCESQKLIALQRAVGQDGTILACFGAGTGPLRPGTGPAV